MLPEIRDWYYALCKGRVANYVARGEERPERVIKPIQTIKAKGNISEEAVERMLAEIDSESVRPFLGPPWNQPERLQRFWAIRDSLLSRQT